MNVGGRPMAGMPVLFAGFFSVVVECTLLFSLFLSCIEEGMSRSVLGVVMAVCAVIPFVAQKVFARVEALLLSRLLSVWLGGLLACGLLTLPLLVLDDPGPALLLAMLCLASMLFFLLFQVFEMQLSLLSVANRLTSRQANLYLQVAMTVGSAIGGFCAGQVLDSLGLRGIGATSIILTILAAAGVALFRRAEAAAAATAPAARDPAPRAEAGPSRMPARGELGIAFGFLLALAVAPATLNFLLPWLVTAENGWSAADFGRLDFLAAFGAFVAIMAYGACSAWGRWLGLACFAVASVLVVFHDSFPHLALLCLLWGLGMNLLRMRAREIFFDALRSSGDALLWSQRLGLLRVSIEASVPLGLGLFATASPSHLFALVAWGITGSLGVLAMLEYLSRRTAPEPLPS